MPVENHRHIIGYDPGTVNQGIVYYSSDKLIAYQIKIIRDPDPVMRIQNQQAIMQMLFDYIDTGFSTNNIEPRKMIIEGSAFGARFRQVELGEIRAIMAIWGLDHNFNVQIVAPNSIRKKVFGSGKTKAHDVWSGLPNDALAALSCIYYQ